MADASPPPAPPTDPVVFGYDGTALSTLAIERAGRELAPGRRAVVVCVWNPGDVGFAPVDDTPCDAGNAIDVRQAAERAAAHGATLAAAAGFEAESLAVEAAPTWEGLVHTAEERGGSLIVVGSHRRSGIIGHVVGSVASAVVSHAPCDVLLVHPPR
jgi:nucleotide-binding universal stress UspA family protein